MQKRLFPNMHMNFQIKQHSVCAIVFLKHSCWKIHQMVVEKMLLVFQKGSFVLRRQQLWRSEFGTTES